MHLLDRTPHCSLMLVLTLAGLSLCVDAAEPGTAALLESEQPEAEAADERRIWERTRETAGEWWHRSRAFADRALTDAKDLFGDNRDFTYVWQTVVPKLDAALTLEERNETLPARAWLGTDQRANRAAINALLDEAVEILSVSPLQNERERVRSLQLEIERVRAEIAEARQKRITAPSESTLRKTVADYDQIIAAGEADIRRLNRELSALKRAFAQDLRGIGLELDTEQIELLLASVVGDNWVDLGILFDNVKAITQQLEELVVQSGEDLASARRYYGLYVVLLQSLNRMHLQIEEAIGEQYLPQIDAIIARAQALSGETRRLQRESPERQELLAANLAAQQVTIQAAEIYRDDLKEQARQVRAARAELEKDIAAAWNTYETVRVSGEFVNLVRSSQQLLEGLMNRQVPALRPFENREMQRELQKLTEQLRG
ncbi:hypothetical protein [Thiocapsa imhoffii]|uniref:hypothetical protein n=1 Tax=Thiocapsa imhoffii TaxID=382777 RepID=UPI001903427B|nr:hypothetical protein [Thiocapsa imhoffii]